MDKRTNNYVVIIIVLLLVVATIAGAGLCYLSWADEYTPSNGNSFDIMQSTEVPAESGGNGVSEDDLANAREEGRQELLDSIKEELDANVSAEDILSGLLAENTGEATEDSGTDNTNSSETGQPNTESQEEGLRANTVTMEQIHISADGEYAYIKDGKTVSHKGVDVSKYQKAIDWKKVAAEGVEYAFIRVGCRGYGKSGTLLTDDYFHQNVKGALAEDIQVGAYFFSQALNVEEAIEEAELVIKELGDYEITYPVAIDIERVNGQTARQDALTTAERTEVCIAFCERIREAGYTPMVYGDLETFSELLNAEQLEAYDFWICETGGTMTFPYEFAVWQYSHEGTVAGISGDTSISISLKEW